MLSENPKQLEEKLILRWEKNEQKTLTYSTSDMKHCLLTLNHFLNHFNILYWQKPRDSFYNVKKESIWRQVFIL